MEHTYSGGRLWDRPGQIKLEAAAAVLDSSKRYGSACSTARLIN
jgi:hypothetical protein